MLELYYYTCRPKVLLCGVTFGYLSVEIGRAIDANLSETKRKEFYSASWFYDNL